MKITFVLWQQVLELAQKYCEEREIPFPKIKLSDEDEKKPKECYMFVDNNNPKAPIVLHFPLVNDTFRKYKAPGKGSVFLLSLSLVLTYKLLNCYINLR